MKQFTGMHSKPSSLFHAKQLHRTRKSKIFKVNVSSFSFKSFERFETNLRSNFLYSRFTSRALTSLIMPVGITVKSGPEYWPITGLVIVI